MDPLPSWVVEVLGRLTDEYRDRCVWYLRRDYYPTTRDEALCVLDAIAQHGSVLGLVLHPFDLATNKVLALVGRLEPRDFIDVLTCDRRLQPLGYLAWAACGKDPGFSPGAILGQAARGARYTQAELASLDFESGPPDAATISREWHDALTAAHGVVAELPAGEVGRAVLDREGRLFRGTQVDLRAALGGDGLVFHPGRIRGALPRLLS
jgi:hypothetical protein